MELTATDAWSRLAARSRLGKALAVMVRTIAITISTSASELSLRPSTILLFVIRALVILSGVQSFACETLGQVEGLAVLASCMTLYGGENFSRLRRSRPTALMPPEPVRWSLTDIIGQARSSLILEKMDLAQIDASVQTLRSGGLTNSARFTWMTW
jgi:hypothetical protein